MSGKDNSSIDFMRRSIRVLIVDDDEPHAQSVSETLKRVGYHCTVALSGEQAAVRIENHAYDVVVTDLMMNEVDG